MKKEKWNQISKKKKIWTKCVEKRCKTYGTWKAKYFKKKTFRKDNLIFLKNKANSTRRYYNGVQTVALIGKNSNEIVNPFEKSQKDDYVGNLCEGETLKCTTEIVDIRIINN